MGNAKIQYTLSQQESEDQPKTTSNTQGKVEKINFVKTFDTPELAAKFKRLIPKDFAEKTTVEGGKITVADITDPQKKNLMATALKFVADNAPKKKPMKEGEIEKPNPNDDYWRDANGLTDEYYEEYKKWLDQQKKNPMKESVKDQIKKAIMEVLKEERFKKGTDIGKKGPGFKKVAAAASKEYGSKEAGQKVAGSILQKVLKKEGLSDMMYNVFKGKNSFKNRIKTTPEVVNKLAQISKEKGINVDESGRWAWKEGSDKMDWNYDAKDGYLYYGDEYKDIINQLLKK
jgi:uncharacterized membrane protein YheB (UPF0754 family)